MKVVITGVAGFIGSTLAERCLDQGWQVVGYDNLSDYYDVALKEHNLSDLLRRPDFTLVRGDIRTTLTVPALDGVDVVFHQAGQPGVRASWQTGFGTYCDANILATQSLLEVCRQAGNVRVVMASSSSVYGNAERYPVLETDETRPFSPYGVTKLAAERLAVAYGENFGIPVVALRYFTVFGPRQRPDMAMHRLIRSALTRTPFPLYGDGSQIRDFTFVDDVVAANLAAAGADLDGPLVANICGGSSISLREVLDLIGEITGEPVLIDQQASVPGDVTRTGGDGTRAALALDWQSRVTMREGLQAQVAWMRSWLDVQAVTPSHQS